MDKLLEEMKSYIEDIMMDKEAECYSGKRLPQLIKEKEMPSIYYQILDKIKDGESNG